MENNTPAMQPNEAPEQLTSRQLKKLKKQENYEPKLTKEELKQDRKQRRRLWRRLKRQHWATRLLSGILIFLLGFNCFLIAIAGGGLLAFNLLSIDRVEKITGSFGLDSVLTPNGDVDLTALTITGWIKELSTIFSDIDSYSLDTLTKTYGISLPENVRSLFPDQLWEMKISELKEGETAFVSVANNIPTSYFYQYLGEEFLSVPAKATLADREIGLIMTGDYADFLRGTYLGYFTGCTYTQEEDGTFTLSYTNPEQKTMLEALAGIEMGALLDVILGNGDVYGLIHEQLGDQLLSDLFGNTDSAILNAITDANYVSELFSYNEESKRYELNLHPIADDLYVGSLLGYKEVLDEDSNALIGWQTADGESISKLLDTVANIKIGTLLDGNVDLTTICGDLSIGDLQNYTRVIDSETGAIIDWLDENGEKAASIQRKLCSVTLASVIDGSFTIDTTFDGLTLGEVQGYTPLYDATGALTGWENNGEPVTGVDKALANLNLTNILNGEFSLSETFTDVYLGEAQGYIRKTDPTTGEFLLQDNKYIWLQATTDESTGDTVYEELNSFNNALAGLELSSAVDGTIDLSVIFQGLYLGDIQGYTRGAEKTTATETSVATYYWEKTEGSETIAVGAMEEAIANIALSEVLDGNLDLQEACADLYFGDTLGYRRKTDPSSGDYIINENGDFQWEEKIESTDAESGGTSVVWQDAATLDNTLANIAVADVLRGEMDMDSIFDELYFGDMMNYEKVDTSSSASNPTYEWKNSAGEIVTGLERAIADVKISEVLDGTFDPDTLVNTLQLFEILNMTPVDYVKTESDGVIRLVVKTATDTSEDVVTLYFNTDGALCGGAMSALAESNTSSLDADVQASQIGKMLSFINIGQDWYSYELEEMDGVSTGAYILTPAQGIIKSFVDLSIDDLSDSTKLTSAIKTAKLADALGYTKKADGFYEINASGEEVKATGILATLVEKNENLTISDISSTVEDLEIGSVMGYSKSTEAGTWVDADGNEPDVLLTPFMDLTVAGMTEDGALQEKIGALYVKDILGYTYDTETNKWLDAEGGELNQMMVSLGESTVSGVSNTIDGLQMGVVFDCTKNEQGVWCYSDGSPATGVIRAIADIEMQSMDDPYIGVQSIMLGSIMGYDQDDTTGTWVNADGKEATGIVAAFASMKVSEMETPANLTARVQSINLSAALGYTKVDGTWYSKYDATNPSTNKEATGIFLRLMEIQDENGVDGLPIKNLSTEINKVQIGYVLNYTYDNNGWYDSTGTPASGIAAALADTTIAQLPSKIKALTIADLFSEESLNTGFLSLLPHDTAITEMDTVMTGIFDGENAKTIGDFMDAGLITIDEKHYPTLRYCFNTNSDPTQIPTDDIVWKSQTLSSFVSGILDKITALMPTSLS